MTTTVYQPGVCNIGPAEIRQRRSIGIGGLVVTVVAVVLLVVFQVPAPWRLLVFIPAAAGASGFLQAALHFCTGFAMKGVFNFGDRGTQEAVHEQEYRKKDQRKATLILIGAAAIGVVVALIAFFLP